MSTLAVVWNALRHDQKTVNHHFDEYDLNRSGVLEKDQARPRVLVSSCPRAGVRVFAIRTSQLRASAGASSTALLTSASAHSDRRAAPCPLLRVLWATVHGLRPAAAIGAAAAPMRSPTRYSLVIVLKEGIPL